MLRKYQNHCMFLIFQGGRLFFDKLIVTFITEPIISTEAYKGVVNSSC